MEFTSRRSLFVPLLLAGFLPASAEPARPDPSKNSDSRILLDLPGSGTDPTAIAYADLPVIKGAHAVVCPADPTLKFQLHSYLIHHDGRYWCMWSQGPPVEDEPSQVVRYATSEDGLKWSEPRTLAGPPKDGYAHIARGFWRRDGELVALYADFKGKGAFGVNKELRLEASLWDKNTGAWIPKGLVFKDNFPPQKLPTGEWMVTRRDSRFNVFVLIGGKNRLDDWKSIPVVERRQVKGFSPDEPIWWAQPDQTLVALYRDNGGSMRLFRSFSGDNGATWTTPVPTNFPNATSKMFSLRTNAGDRVLLSNANPGVGRRQMYLSLSSEGRVFTRMARLSIPFTKPATFQYPHAIEHEGHLLIAFSRTKTQIEVLKIPLRDIEQLRAEARGQTQ